MDAFFLKGSRRKLRPDEVDAIVARLLMAPSVDKSQVPMYQPSKIDCPEVSLHRAILFDALQCAIRHQDSRSTEQRSEARMALRWIESNNESYFLSFVPICQRLGLDPSWIRRLIRKSHKPLAKALKPAEAA